MAELTRDGETRLARDGKGLRKQRFFIDGGELHQRVGENERTETVHAHSSGDTTKVKSGTEY